MSLFRVYRQNARIIIEIFGIKITLKNPLINHISDCCFIPDLDELRKKGTAFVHPIGIVIVKGAKFGNNCRIFHNVTIGRWRNKVPKIGNNVVIFPNSLVIGDVEIGDNCIIGGGSVVTKSIPPNKIVVGNPARIIKDIEGKENYWYRPWEYDEESAVNEVGADDE